MRYRLATYRECKAHREWNTTCPDCGRKGKFSPYIDTVTMQPVDDKRCGRCNRLSNCGYHLPPRMVARTGGKQGFKESMLQPLIGYDVEVYPDADALTDWYARAVEMNRTLGTHLHIPTWYYDLMNHDEARRAGLDLADVVMGEGMS